MRISVQNEWGIVTLTNRGDTHEDEPQVWVMTAEEAGEMLVALASAVVNAMADVSNAWRLGECATCGNTRMVDVETRGRTMREHCPDCMPGTPKSAWPDWRTKAATT
jgi:hypothetical protein